MLAPLCLLSPPRNFDDFIDIKLDMWVADLTHIYVPVGYAYTSKVFDNTALTYATDWAVAGLMTFGVMSIVRTARPSALRTRAVAMFVLYAISVLFGAQGHKDYTSLELMNSKAFRVIWSVCVGAVTAAGGVQGAIATEILIGTPAGVKPTVKLGPLPFRPLPEWFWVAYSCTFTTIVFFGGISMQRPAADIFIAGFTQAPPAVYITLCSLVNAKRAPLVSRGVCALLMASFFLNAPLIFAYPIVLRYTNLSLGVINASLHAWLALAWGLQCAALRLYCIALAGPMGNHDIRGARMGFAVEEAAQQGILSKLFGTTLLTASCLLVWDLLCAIMVLFLWCYASLVAGFSAVVVGVLSLLARLAAPLGPVPSLLNGTENKEKKPKRS